MRFGLSAFCLILVLASLLFGQFFPRAPRVPAVPPGAEAAQAKVYVQKDLAGSGVGYVEACVDGYLYLFRGGDGVAQMMREAHGEDGVVRAAPVPCGDGGPQR
jgi:hypothetical protein